MDAKELRIGNLLWFDMNDPVDEDEPEQGYVISKVTIDVLKDLDRYNPLILNEELLIKLGFSRDVELEKLERYTYKQFTFGDQKTNSFIRVCYHVIGKFTVNYQGNPIYKPKYVHQLQNLYFVLTNKELIIKTVEK